MIKYLFMDVDGTLTDGKIYISLNGEAMKAFNVKDGYGIHDMLIPAGIIPVVLTGRESSIVSNRCKELGITEVYQGVSDKSEVIRNLSSQMKDVAFIGDDINDLKCMRMVKASGGIVGCPADAALQVKEIADICMQHNGGDGAIREFIEYILSEG